MKVLGIDPGGAATGIVVRHRDDLDDWTLLERRDWLDEAGWIDEHVDQLAALVSTHDIDLLAIETLHDPTPQMGVTSVRGLIDTSAVIGAVLAWWLTDPPSRPHVLVPPGRHGRAAEGYGRRGLLACYPQDLIGDREQAGTGRLRHVRAAFDVAAAGARQHRLEETA